MSNWVVVSMAGLSIGFMGSLHCIAMCGPLAMALPLPGVSQWRRWSGILAYNVGRAMTYAIVGIAVGTIGSTFNMWGFQQWLSIIAGVLMLLFALIRVGPVSRVHLVQQLQAWVRSQLSRLLVREHNLKTLFIAGTLNALLPCGLVYIGLTGALATGRATGGGLLMFMFGMGTMPAMMFIMALQYKPGFVLRHKLRRAIPYVISIMAVMLILRGLNLGIPYISPMKTMDLLSMPTCHQAK